MPPITTSGATVIVMIDITISFCFCCNRFMCQEIGKRTLKRILNSSRMLQYLQCWRQITTVSCHTLGSVFKFYAVPDTCVSEYKIQFQPGNHQLSLFGAPSKECIQSYDQYLGGNTGQISNKFWWNFKTLLDTCKNIIWVATCVFLERNISNIFCGEQNVKPQFYQPHRMNWIKIVTSPSLKL